MPHLVLEYSANIVEKNKFSELFQKIHTLLAETLPTDLASCKSRATECLHYYVGDGKLANAFIHLDLKIKAGRAFETLQKLGDEILTLLKEHFIESTRKLSLQITLAINELPKAYFLIN